VNVPARLIVSECVSASTVSTAAAALHAGTVTTLVTLLLLAAAFGLGSLLPQRARAHAG
jgi:hypothetical protein